MLTGSHFDSVPHGGAYDGPLGIVSAFLAVDELRAAGATPVRPMVVAAFVEEEGARFGVPCLGSRLLTGAIDVDRAAGLRDAAGVSFAEALGHRPAGADPALLGRFAAFVELHVEQGRALVDADAPVAVASAIWPHGRWRLRASPARATTPARPGWPTAATRCSRSRSPCWRRTRRPGCAARTPPSVGWRWNRTPPTRSRRR